jgi:hypothetical protein
MHDACSKFLLFFFDNKRRKTYKMMKYLQLTVTALICTVFFTGCSTVFNTSTQMVELNTMPYNAKIIIDGNKFGTTPQKVNLERGDTHLVRFELDGYEPYEIMLTQKVSNWVWLNVLNGFVPGWAIDMFSGSMYNVLPDKINAELPPAKPAPPTKKK